MSTSNVISANLGAGQTLSYLALSNSATQTPSLNAAPNYATWDTTNFSSGSLTQNANGSVTLTAGKTYRLYASLQHPGVISGTGVFDFYDSTNAVSIGNPMELIAITASFNGSSILSQATLFTPTVDSDVGLRYASGAMGDIGLRSTFIIEEVPITTYITGAETTITNNNGTAGQALISNGDGTSTWSNGGLVSINAQTGTAYTLALTDVGGIVDMNNAAANTLTVPLNATVAFPVGTSIAVSMSGAGVTSIAGAAGVTINSDTGKLNISVQYATASLLKTATDTWLLVGSLA